MSKLEEIEFNIRGLVRINERIVSKYDSKLLCSDFEYTKSGLKELVEEKRELIEALETSLNEFFNINENFISKKLKLISFKLIPTLIDHKFRFNLPKSVDTSSRQYFCYISLMDKLVKQYDVITHEKDGYYILDITSHLNINNLFAGD